MTIAELKILLDLHLDSKIDVLKEHAKKFNLGYFFVDSDTGKCYLFDKSGNEDDISKVTRITENMINKGTLTNITIPNCMTSIGAMAFYRCSRLMSMTIPNTVTSIGGGTFYGCSGLTSVTIPDSVKSIKDDVFGWCSGLTSMTIGNNVISIGEYTFNGCIGLTSVMIPNSVTNIGHWAFAHCRSLKSLIFKGKTLDEVKAMNDYPWGIEDESIIKCEA